MHRSPKRAKKYRKQYKSDDYENTCVFCRIPDEQIVKKYIHFDVIENIFAYEIWDHHVPEKHYMLVPKRHITAIGDLSKNESAEFLKFITDYEEQGFSSYTRAPDNVMKSVEHLHTHLFKLGGKEKKFLLYLKKPHILLHR